VGEAVYTASSVEAGVGAAVISEVITGDWSGWAICMAAVGVGVGTRVSPSAARAAAANRAREHMRESFRECMVLDGGGGDETCVYCAGVWVCGGGLC